MPREAISRLTTPSICRTCRTKLLQAPRAPLRRPFTTTPRTSAGDSNSPLPPGRPASGLSDLTSAIFGNRTSTGLGRRATNRTTDLSKALQPRLDIPPQDPATFSSLASKGPPPEPHHLHIYSTKHNTHLTLTRPNREPILSFSAGNIGFRKAQRGSYDAAFQLAAYVLKMMKDRGLLRQVRERELQYEGVGEKTEGAVKTMEVVLRGYGKGREAVVKALMGTEGRELRDKITRVSDATRLKFGGTRSPKPRRLG